MQLLRPRLRHGQGAGQGPLPGGDKTAHTKESFARKRALLAHFGSPDAVLAASQEQLQSVPGLPAKTGRELHAFLHRAG